MMCFVYKTYRMWSPSRWLNIPPLQGIGKQNAVDERREVGRKTIPKLIAQHWSKDSITDVDTQTIYLDRPPVVVISRVPDTLEIGRDLKVSTQLDPVVDFE